MYCVVQKLTKKKPDSYGNSKDLIVTHFTFGTEGNKKTKYSYQWSEESFERPILDNYKISIHESYRENGQVKKKQYHVCTMSHYNMIEYSFYDCTRNLNEIADKLKITEEELCDMIDEKLNPIQEKIRQEYKETEEYQRTEYLQSVLRKYQEEKKRFEDLYVIDSYDYCYDVFGNLMNEQYLKQVKEEAAIRKEYTERSYQSREQSNYSNYQSSYSVNIPSNYTDEEKLMLKKIYKVAAKNFHPDITNDNGEMMKFLTKLKQQWGV